MKIIVLLSTLLSVSFAVDTEFYTTADDYFDMESIVKDTERFKTFAECFLDKTPCDKISQSYRDLAPEAVATACLKCNDAQKHLVNVFFIGLKNNNPKYYNEYFSKYDPEGKYKDNLLEAVKGF